MKKCPICGNRFEHENMCPTCGMPLIDTETNSAVESEPKKNSRFSTKKKKEEPLEANPVPVMADPFAAAAGSTGQEKTVAKEPEIESPEIEVPREEKVSVNTAQEEDIYGLGVKPTTSNSPMPEQKPARSSSHDGKITISFHPAYVVAVVVAILLIVAIIFIVRGVKAKKEAEEMYQYQQVIQDEDQGAYKEETDAEVAAETGMAEENTEDVAMEDTDIHNYQVVISDASWSQAKAECERAGGYLVRINSAEEYHYIIDMLNDGNYTKIHFYLGGRRDDDGRAYFWVDENNTFMGEVINRSDSWTNGYWFNNEPSFEDTGSDAAGAIQENVMNLFYVKDTWYLNDSSGDMAAYYPELLSGKVGYIIEFE